MAATTHSTVLTFVLGTAIGAAAEQTYKRRKAIKSNAKKYALLLKKKLTVK